MPLELGQVLDLESSASSVSRLAFPCQAPRPKGVLPPSLSLKVPASDLSRHV